MSRPMTHVRSPGSMDEFNETCRLLSSWQRQRSNVKCWMGTQWLIAYLFNFSTNGLPGRVVCFLHFQFEKHQNECLNENVWLSISVSANNCSWRQGSNYCYVVRSLKWHHTCTTAIIVHNIWFKLTPIITVVMVIMIIIITSAPYDINNRSVIIRNNNTGNINIRCSSTHLHRAGCTTVDSKLNNCVCVCVLEQIDSILLLLLSLYWFDLTAQMYNQFQRSSTCLGQFLSANQSFALIV